MIWKLKTVVLAAALLSLAACDETMEAVDTAPQRSGSADAEFACAKAVNRNFGRAVATVTSSQFSEANTIVTLTAEGQNFRCLTSDDGVVAELTAVS